ncbi:hypothetical protein E2I00_012811 [Balaenoptera physalus]|uniref:Uncharacterized protein n=1 Tax=Balaenoptera physalus TaxID=9770 RepID=A0A643BRW7_BALPH|nr:hypothetical protein E2I00_012811 [Balaenoptera physalus]
MCGAGAPWLPPTPPGHWGPHQPCGVQPRLRGSYDTQSGVGGASGGCRHLASGRGAQRLEVDVLEGTLQCPESGRLFPISCGIPNMLLSDEETET